MTLLGSASIASLNNDSVQAASVKTTKLVKKSKARRQRTTKGLFAVKAGINGTLNNFCTCFDEIEQDMSAYPEYYQENK